MMVGADTGPIIALGKVDRIALLAIFEAPIVIPPHGRRELLSKPTSETQEIERALRRRIQVRDVPALRATTKEVLTLPALKYGDSTIHPAEPTSSNACAVLPCCPGAFTAQS